MIFLGCVEGKMCFWEQKVECEVLRIERSQAGAGLNAIGGLLPMI